MADFDFGQLPPLAGRMQQYVREEGLWEPGAHLLVAVSGGADSVALLDVLHTLVTAGVDPRLTVAHVHHGLREEAEADAAFVRELAERMDLPYLLARVDVPARVAETGQSVEEAARELRYAALQRLADDANADCIATAHTADDQAETVLMRLLRGTGLAGLAGIPPKRGNIVRPFLNIWRAEIMAHIRSRGLDYRTDQTNYSTDFTRNRVRLELLPHLEETYAPRLRHRLHHLAELAREDTAALDDWAEQEYARQRIDLRDGPALPDRMDLPRAITWRLWRLAITEARGNLRDIGYDHLDSLRHLEPGQQTHLPGARVLHEAGWLVFLPVPPTEEPILFIPEEPLPVPGRACFLEAGCCLTTELVEMPVPVAGGNIAIMNANAVAGDLTVRAWRPGDRFRPFGAPGSRKLQDIFVDAGVPKRLRERIPVVSDREGIVWLAGFRIADRVKMNPETNRALRMTIEWELNPWTLTVSNNE